MDSEDEMVGGWYDATTDGVVIPLLSGMALIGAVAVAGVVTLASLLEVGAVFMYTRWKKRRQA